MGTSGGMPEVTSGCMPRVPLSGMPTGTPRATSMTGSLPGSCPGTASEGMSGAMIRAVLGAGGMSGRGPPDVPGGLPAGATPYHLYNLSRTAGLPPQGGTAEAPDFLAASDAVLQPASGSHDSIDRYLNPES
uniref:Uncharacterized protein n=1 Tax=Eutreptiella gymnastica TaxID=73025 RepID=A0A7S4FF57_9EUGL